MCVCVCVCVCVHEHMHTRALKSCCMVENARQRFTADPTGESTGGWSVKGNMASFSEALIPQLSYGTRKEVSQVKTGLEEHSRQNSMYLCLKMENSNRSVYLD